MAGLRYGRNDRRDRQAFTKKTRRFYSRAEGRVHNCMTVLSLSSK